ncbi:LysR family transcriptional regulator [Methylobacterium sp. R2-1]|uniref:LysR family transcriptional regulator n=1 Tax=Methylobacterium sp. R2-1 TaxID=2587064 RepID=UPI00160E2C34|nr:LysR family transcriptional regulator [Methylobacterium sp. R2-1]MBB2961950.1 DNA-binding transcriptional LysR family regulator [Methylobacterium sp. R2-1]
MLDHLTLDQLRTFVAAVDTGSFSAAGRKLGRAQSLVSQSLANLEAQSGVKLFDRSSRYPVLTEPGRVLLAQARATVAAAETFKAQARDLAGGLEPEVSVVLDVLFPIQVVTEAVAAFQPTFSTTPLRIQVETRGAVIAPVVDGRCAFAVAGATPLPPPELAREPLRQIELVMVAAPTHPLVRRTGPIPTADLAEHVQLVLTDRSDLTKGREFGVSSPRSWRLADLGAKQAFLRAGLAWGGMPHDLVTEDLASGHLVRLDIAALPKAVLHQPMWTVYPMERPPGPAGRWLIAQLRSADPLC